jgi:hypothetical protein
MIILEGINDIQQTPHQLDPAKIIEGLQEPADRAHVGPGSDCSPSAAGSIHGRQSATGTGRSPWTIQPDPLACRDRDPGEHRNKVAR